MIIFTGDVSLTDGYFNVGFGVGSRMAKGENPFALIHKSPENIWVGNFEGVASSSSCNEGYAGQVFRIHPDTLPMAGLFDVFGFANNHAMQHGAEAYHQTVDALQKRGYKVFGTQKQRSVVLSYKGKMISLTGMSYRVDEFSESPCYWYIPEFIDLEHEICSLPTEAFKVLFVHWGNEYINHPSTAQKQFAHWLVDIGVDLIIGMHSHVLQGFEDYHDSRIYYSLGNFVFDMPSEACRYGAIVGLDFDSKGVPFFSESHVYINKKGYPSIVDSLQVPKQYGFPFLNECLAQESNSEPYHQEALRGYRVYRKANRLNVLSNTFSHPKAMMAVINDFIKRKL